MTLRDAFCWRSVNESAWLDDGWEQDIAPADSLQDLRTTDNALSIYLFPKDDGEQIERRIAVAMASTKRKIDHYEYVVFDGAVLEPLADQIQEQPGSTPDKGINDLHRDIVQLSAGQLAMLADAVWNARDRMVRLLDTQMAGLIAEGIRDGNIAESDLRQGITDPLKSRNLL